MRRLTHAAVVAALGWTEAAPSEPGWYWVRQWDATRGAYGRAVPGRVDAPGWVVVHGRAFLVRAFPHLRWAGPIPEPEEG